MPSSLNFLKLTSQVLNFTLKIFQAYSQYRHTIQITVPISDLNYGKSFLKFKHRTEPLDQVRKILLADNFVDQDFSDFSFFGSDFWKICSKFNHLGRKIYVKKLVIRNYDSANLGDLGNLDQHMAGDSLVGKPNLAIGKTESKYLAKKSYEAPKIIYLTESGNKNLFYLKIFAKYKFIEKITVNLIDDPNTNHQILPDLMKNYNLLKMNNTLGFLEPNPSIIGVNEEALYDGIDQLFQCHESMKTKYSSGFRMKNYPQAGFRFGDFKNTDSENDVVSRLGPEYWSKPYEPNQNNMLLGPGHGVYERRL